MTDKDYAKSFLSAIRARRAMSATVRLPPLGHEEEQAIIRFAEIGARQVIREDISEAGDCGVSV